MTLILKSVFAIHLCIHVRHATESVFELHKLLKSNVRVISLHSLSNTAPYAILRVAQGGIESIPVSEGVDISKNASIHPALYPFFGNFLLNKTVTCISNKIEINCDNKWFHKDKIGVLLLILKSTLIAFYNFPQSFEQSTRHLSSGSVLLRVFSRTLLGAIHQLHGVLNGLARQLTDKMKSPH